MMDAAARRRAVQALNDEDFELFVHQLLAADDGTGRTWRKLRSPDGGADSLVRDGIGAVDWVVQCKHYPDGISSAHWGHCERSLDDAVATWKPPRVTFVFPLDFTAKLEREFDERLVKRNSDVVVDALLLSELDALAAKHPDVAARFLGPDSKTIADAVERATRLGGNRLERGRDLAARSQELAAFADEADPRFRYQQSSGPLDLPAPQFERPPYISVEVLGDQHRVRVDAWTREEADVDLPEIRFTDDADGLAAREEVRERLAAGQPAEVDGGVSIVLHQGPTLVRELAADHDLATGTATFGVTAPVPVEVILSSAGHGKTVRTFQMRPVPPPPDKDVAFASLVDGIWFELDFKLHPPSHVETKVTTSARFGSNARVNADAARWLLQWLEQERVKWRSATLPGYDGPLPESVDFDAEELRLRIEVYETIAYIEDELGIELTLPECIRTDELNVIGTVADILRTGKGTATVQNARGVVESSKLATVAAGFPKGLYRRPVVYELWGQRLRLGLGEYEIPPMKVASIRSLGHSPNSPAEVELVPAGSDQGVFRLLSEEPPPVTASGAVLLG